MGCNFSANDAETTAYDGPSVATSVDAGPLPKHGGTTIEGDESIMSRKAHGTTPHAVQAKLRWNADRAKADEICSFNRHYAEHSGYFLTTPFADDIRKRSAQGQKTVFYDSVSGQPLYVAPVGRSVEDFLKESRAHGWPSFRDAEVVWDNVRILKKGEAVSTMGTHLGHNLPDHMGNRHCINLVSVAGYPLAES
mmetsp:Transcript_62112/g.122763  ORF Transcript_62112/g.122763 Transcript_62112/m.122763 type:complete len:194 (-) Transcript_62112:163-744(-)